MVRGSAATGTRFPASAAALAAALLLAWPVPLLRAAGPDPAATKFFEQKVRPVLATRCFECHGPAKQKGGLRLDSLPTILRGGDRGPAVRPGKPEESPLVTAVRHGDAL